MEWVVNWNFTTLHCSLVYKRVEIAMHRQTYTRTKRHKRTQIAFYKRVVSVCLSIANMTDNGQTCRHTPTTHSSTFPSVPPPPPHTNTCCTSILRQMSRYPIRSLLLNRSLTLVSLKVLSQFFPSAESNGMFSICVSLLSVSIAASENSSSRHLQTSCHFRRQGGQTHPGAHTHAKA